MNINTSMGSVSGNMNMQMPKIDKTMGNKSGFANTMKAVGKYVEGAEAQQEATDISIKELMSGKSEDITSVVASMAKADMSFKLLVGVRNKLVEAYKQTMNMQI